jgi:TolB-like protein/DNA-binding winged helix-turn-helix (wHTH) protein/tetratricopeptide (TPR) repeat protein
MIQTESGARGGGATPYRFDDVVVDPAAHSLLRAGVSQPVEPKAFAVLLALLQHPGELIGRDDLLDLVWGHRHVTPGVLTRVIAQLRHALDDDPQQPRYIQTRHALGYSFIGQLQGDADIGTPPAPATDRTGVDDLPATGLQVASPELPASQREQVGSPRQERADPESAWSVAESTPARGLGNDQRRKQRPWLVLTVLLSCVLVVWAVIQRVTTPAPRIAASIAVMPFTSLSNHPGDEYFAEGLAEEMRDALAGVKGLKVAVPLSSDARNGAADAKTLGARLGVAAILDASVRREGPRIRITARLSDTATGFTLWSHTYDRELSGVFATQSEIAGEVVHSLLGAIPGESDALAKRLTPTHSAAAFDIYLQGLNLLHHDTSSDTAKAIDRFGQALKEDSGFAKAQAGICRAEIWRLESKHSAEAFDNARLACQRAAQMDPTLPEVDLAMGDLYRVAGDSERALQYYRNSSRAPALQVRAHIGAAQVYAARGQHDLSAQEFQQALQLSPGDPAVLAQVGYQQYLDGNVPQAVVSFREAVELRPGDAILWGTLGALYMAAGNNADAEQALEHSIALEPAAATLTNLGLLKYQAGDYAAAVDLRRQATVLDPQDFMTWGNLGDALRADPQASAVDVHKAYEQAAARAEAYLKVQPNDARAVALLGLYQVVLGDAARARMLVKRAESLPGQPGEVALQNAETLALLGDIEPARQRLATARAAGIAETLIASNPTFRRLGLLSPPGTAGRSPGAESPASRASKGHPPGERHE